MSAIAARATAAQRAAWNDSSGRTRSRAWWGTRRRSSAVGFAVPMSMPTYTCCESQATISPPARSASARPSALLPDAVGPSTATKRCRAAAVRGASGTAEAPLDLAERQAQQHRAPVRAVRSQIDRVQLVEQGQRLGAAQHVARPNDAVARDGREQVVDAIQLAGAQRRPL